MIASLALGMLALALAVPVPLLLARSRWPAHAPTAALLLWQSIAVAGGLSMIGALLSFGVAPFGDHLLSGVVGLASAELDTIELPNALALAGSVLLTCHLLLNLGLTLVRSEQQRRRHAQLIALLSSPSETLPGARLLDSPAPVAYCLPGALGTVTVVSAGLIELLDECELSAVIEHERAHVRQRHDVVLVAFRAWYSALPWFPIAFRAQSEVGLLIEMLADDRARTIASDAVLARAIVLVGGSGLGGSGAPGPMAGGIPDAGGLPGIAGAPLADMPAVTTPALSAVAGFRGSVVNPLGARLTRLDAPPLPRGASLAVVLSAAALLAVPTALLFAPALLP